jgi:regulator of protease activity HflC (stomatin/prohibitin superfamily)
VKRSIQKNGLINLLAILLIGVAAFVVARNSNTAAGLLSLNFLGIGLLAVAVSWFQTRLEDREKLEKQELDEMAKGHAGTAMFESRESELFPAQRSREQFERFFVPGFTIILGILQLVGAWLCWRWLTKVSVGGLDLRDHGVAMALFGLFGLILFLLGKFAATIARLEDHRLLRPGASYLLLCAWLCAAVAVGLVLVEVGFPRADLVVAYVICSLLGLTGLETVVNLILEIYRPRVRGKAGRPLYESRLVALLSQPEGLITTAAEAIDYQFGFKVSETWFYRTLREKVLVWFLALQLGALIASSMVTVIEPGETGLLERFGMRVKTLGPGPHIDWFWPLAKVRRYRTGQIQSFEIGTAPDAAQETGPVLWTVAHNKEDNFLVANRRDWGGEAETNAVGETVTRRPPPINLLTGTIPVQYQIADIGAWEYNNEDAPSLLEDLAYREVVRFLAGVDVNELLSYGRGKASETLRERIQQRADERKLGARILLVGLQDLHPPVKVAPEYEKVVGAVHEKQAKILAAQAAQIRTNAIAEARSTNAINVASSDRVRTEISAVARAALFTNQLPAFEAAPKVYATRKYLQTFVSSTAGARKYLLLTTNTHDVLIFDLQEKIREDILSTTPIGQKK